MCLLVVNVQGSLTQEQFKNAWANNPHGGGFVYVKPDGKMKVRKTQKGPEQFFAMYEEAKAESPESVFIVHFRWATHGKKCTENTHPFKLNSGLYFAHNGIISGYGSSHTSDTRDFGERILKHLPDEFYLNADFVEMIKDHIGAGNKLAFLDKNNQYGIINEKAGDWEEGNWYSNTGHKAKRWESTGDNFWNRYSGNSADAYDDYGWPMQTTDKGTKKKKAKAKTQQNQIGFHTGSVGTQKHVPLTMAHGRALNEKTQQMEDCKYICGGSIKTTRITLEEAAWAKTRGYVPVAKDGAMQWLHTASGAYYSKDWIAASMKWSINPPGTSKLALTKKEELL